MVLVLLFIFFYLNIYFYWRIFQRIFTSCIFLYFFFIFYATTTCISLFLLYFVVLWNLFYNFFFVVFTVLKYFISLNDFFWFNYLLHVYYRRFILLNRHLLLILPFFLFLFLFLPFFTFIFFDFLYLSNVIFIIIICSISIDITVCLFIRWMFAYIIEIFMSLLFMSENIIFVRVPAILTFTN